MTTSKGINSLVGHTGKRDGKTYRSPTYVSWQNMIARCRYPSVPSYANYGARGISVCSKWNRFDNFLQDMGERPDGMTLDRIDSDGDYEPGNCKWSTRSEQQRNHRAGCQCSIHKGA